MSKLYIVPTPLGNIEDITLRALKVLKSVDIILAEDTRKTNNLLKHYNISKKLISYHKFNEHRIVKKLTEQILQGTTMALVSNSGTPGISDPGYLIIKNCIDKNITVECLPGPVALIPALIVSGLPCEKFCFEGFLPHKKGRHKILNQIANENRTIILYEAPHRLIKTLEQLQNYFGKHHQIAVIKEISKIHEQTFRGTINQIIQNLKNLNIKGEYIIVIKGKKINNKQNHKNKTKVK